MRHLPTDLALAVDVENMNLPFARIRNAKDIAHSVWQYTKLGASSLDQVKSGVGQVLPLYVVLPIHPAAYGLTFLGRQLQKVYTLNMHTNPLHKLQSIGPESLCQVFG